MRSVVHVARVEEKKRVQDLLGNWQKSDHLEDICVDGSIILKWLLKKWDKGTDWINFFHVRDQ